MQPLRKFARTHKADVAQATPSKISVMSRDEFVDGPLWNIIRQADASSATTCLSTSPDWRTTTPPTKKNDGWSFVMFTYPSGKENKRRPRIIIVPKDSHTTFIRLAGGRPRHKGKPIPCSWPVPRGRFLDLLHMVTAMRNAHLPLDSACRSFNVAGKLSHKPTGRITAERDTLRPPGRCRHT